MPTLNFMKNGTIRQVQLVTSAKYASSLSVPCVCAYLDGTVYYALTSSLSTNAVAAFRYGGKTYYLVTKHESSEISAWELICSATDATTYTLPSDYDGVFIKIECGVGKGRVHSAAARPAFKKRDKRALCDGARRRPAVERRAYLAYHIGRGKNATA